MRRSRLLSGAAALCAVAFLYIGCARQGPLLAGQITSTEEGPMEGVVVSAKPAGSTITISVVTDAQGRYQFPASKMTRANYSIAIRAVGYDLASPSSVDLTHASSEAIADLQLRPTHDLSRQLTNAEWIASVPGTPSQKTTLRNCVGCHELQYPLRSGHDAEGFRPVLARMATRAQQSIPIRPQNRQGERDREVVGEEQTRIQTEQAAWLATINLSASALSESPDWDYKLQTLPRPKGRATRVVVTEYDLPREGIEPHDVAVGPDGLVWFSSFGEQNIGSMDPKTGKVTEYPVPERKKGFPQGNLSLRFDREGNVWSGNMYQASATRFNPKTGEMKVFPVPDELNKANTQINMTSPQHSHVDGKVWTQNNGFAGIHRIDLATGKWETFEPFKGLPGNHNLYDIVSDSQNNAYFTDFLQDAIGRIDAKTAEITFYHTPTPNSAPRRGQMDDQDRLWFGEYRADRIGMFDTKTKEFKEWPIPTPWGSPYDVAIDKNGHAWTGSMLSDRISRVDTKTGEVIEYLLPRTTNIRRVFVDNSTNPVTFWVGSNHGASIVKLEPLD
jgi:virginiamycin B lyase